MSNTTLQGRVYRRAFTLYSPDGRRAANVLEVDTGETYVDELERADDSTFRNRHVGRLVGPFASPAEAESFIVASPWFCGRQG
jgi:hypothetical protein